MWHLLYYGKHFTCEQNCHFMLGFSYFIFFWGGGSVSVFFFFFFKLKYCSFACLPFFFKLIFLLRERERERKIQKVKGIYISGWYVARRLSTVKTEEKRRKKKRSIFFFFLCNFSFKLVNSGSIFLQFFCFLVALWTNNTHNQQTLWPPFANF